MVALSRIRRLTDDKQGNGLFGQSCSILQTASASSGSHHRRISKDSSRRRLYVLKKSVRQGQKERQLLSRSTAVRQARRYARLGRLRRLRQVRICCGRKAACGFGRSPRQRIALCVSQRRYVSVFRAAVNRRRSMERRQSKVPPLRQYGDGGACALRFQKVFAKHKQACSNS